MKKQDFSFISLVTLLTLGITTRWALPIKIAVIINSLFVLWNVGLQTWRSYYGR